MVKAFKLVLNPYITILRDFINDLENIVYTYCDMAYFLALLSYEQVREH